MDEDVSQDRSDLPQRLLMESLSDQDMFHHGGNRIEPDNCRGVNRQDLMQARSKWNSEDHHHGQGYHHNHGLADYRHDYHHNSDQQEGYQGHQGQCYQGQQNEGLQGQFKLPRGRMGHQRTYSDLRHDYRGGPQKDIFQTDDFNINWNDNHFYSSCQDGSWNLGGFFHRHGRSGRRGSFDENFHSFDTQYQQADPWLYGQTNKKPRGRGVMRNYRPQRRSASHDNISPESTSSSDSSLKRRHESDESFSPEKSRRRFDPPETCDLSASVQNVQSGSSLLEDRANHRPASRSSSRDRLRDSRYGRSETESDSRLSSRKVTWSDQQVSSSTEKSGKNTSEPSHKSRPVKKDRNVVLPDSSSESEGIKKSSKGKVKKRSASPRNTSASRGGSPNLVLRNEEDEGVSVLEKAEKLCKKLRSDREKAKMKQKEEEKFKKTEREKELNRKIETLSEQNKLNIKGVLDSEITSAKIAAQTSQSNVTDERSSLPPKVDSRSVTVRETTKLASSQRATPSRDLTSPNIADRIAQTKADIDAIRAKIEASVEKEMSQSGSSTDSVVQPKYPQATDRTSLVKMVNSPRTTKERLSVAQMLREHARSQTKLSLPRFNLKYSDLCSGSDRFDEYANINVEALTPDVQLQIANIIEADIKPDISELEKLLDQASEGNDQLDSDILKELGVGSPNKPMDDLSSVYTPVSTSVCEAVSTRLQSPKRGRSPSKGYPLSPGLQYHSELLKERSLSPLPAFSDSPVPERDMPNPRDLWKTPDHPTQIIDNLLPERDMPPPRGVLNIDDLKTEHRKSTTSRSNLSSKLPTSVPKNNSSSLPVSSCGVTSLSTVTSIAEFRSTSTLSTQSTIKQEIIDDDYEAALFYKSSELLKSSRIGTDGNPSPKPDPVGNQGDRTAEPLVLSPQFSPVRRNVHTQNLYRGKDELPVRDFSTTLVTSKVNWYSQLS